MARKEGVVAKNTDNKTMVNAEVVVSTATEAKKNTVNIEVSKKDAFIPLKNASMERKIDQTVQAEDKVASNKALNDLQSERLQFIRKQLGIVDDPVEPKKEEKAEEEKPEVKVEAEKSEEISKDKTATDDSEEVKEDSSTTVDLIPDVEKLEKADTQDKSKDEETKSEDETIDPELAKDYAVKKSLKRINTLTSKVKELEAKLQRQTISGAKTGEDLSKWTPEYGEQTKKQYMQALNNAEDLLDSEVQRDENGKELPIDVNGVKMFRKDLRQTMRQLREDVSQIDNRVQRNLAINSERERFQTLATRQIEWYGDDNSPIYQQGVQALDIVRQNGIENTPFAEYIFSLGWDAYAKSQLNNKDANQSKATTTKVAAVKEQPQKMSTPKAAVAPKSIVAQGKKDEVEELKQKAESSGKQEDYQAYLTAFHLRRLGGKH